MTKEEHMNFWQKTAEEDLESAFAIIDSGRYIWCLFIAHLSLEKMLKAYYIFKVGDTVPPKIHNLLRLAKLSDLKLTEDQNEFLSEINRFFLEARYPEYKRSLQVIADEKFTKDYLSKIKDTIVWIMSLMK